MVRLCCQDRNCTPSPSQWQRVPGHACDPSGAPLTQLPRGGSHRSSGGWHMPAPTTQAATETAAEARRSPRNAGDSAHLSPWPTVAHPAPAAEAEHTGRSPGDRVCLTPLPRGASQPTPLPQVQQQRRRKPAPATTMVEPCPTGLTGSLRGRRRCPAEESSRSQGVSNPQKDLTQLGSQTTLKRF